MPSGVIPFKRSVGKQLPGIWATHELITKDVRVLIEPYLPITRPMLMAYQRVRINFPNGSRHKIQKENFSDFLLPGYLALISPRAKLNQPSKFNQHIMSEFGVPTPLAKIAFDAVLSTKVLEVIPESNRIRKIEEFILDGAMHWQSYAVLWDAVRESKYARYGSVRPWVLDMLTSLGLGHVEEKQMLNRQGRPPKIFVPNIWGKHLVSFLDLDSRFQVTDDMREVSRLRGLPTKMGKIKTLERLASGYTDKGLPIPRNVVEQLNDLKLWEEDN